MPSLTFRVNGGVIVRKEQHGVSGMRVEAWDKDLVLDDLVGSAVNDADSGFQMRFRYSAEEWDSPL